jgi:hypothetical protein
MYVVLNNNLLSRCVGGLMILNFVGQDFLIGQESRVRFEVCAMTGWPDDFAKKVAQNQAQPVSCQN